MRSEYFTLVSRGEGLAYRLQGVQWWSLAINAYIKHIRGILYHFATGDAFTNYVPRDYITVSILYVIYDDSKQICEIY